MKSFVYLVGLSVLTAFFVVGCAGTKEEGVWFLIKIVDSTASPTQEYNYGRSDGQVLVFDGNRLAELDLRLGKVRCRFRAYEHKDDIISVPAGGGCSAEEYRVLELTSTALQTSKTTDPRNQIVRIYSKQDQKFLDELLQEKGLSRNDM